MAYKNSMPANEICIDAAPFINKEGDEFKLNLFVYGVTCASCIRSIESALNKQPQVTYARVNMSTKRLVVKWKGDIKFGNTVVKSIEHAGYNTKPFDPELIKNQEASEEKTLLKYLAVAGFAAGNIMMLSFALWTSSAEEMGHETRALFHWFSALIALPTIIYSGRAFFKPAFKALKSKSSNMDVPISMALIITAFVSLYGTIKQQEDVFFDSAVMLLFFLLIGRYLDLKARSKSREAAEKMTDMFTATANIIDNGQIKTIKGRDIKPNMVLQVAAGERIASDGVIIDGQTEIDASLITGETLPRKTSINDIVFAGTLNLNHPIKVRVSKTQENTLLSEIIKLMEKAEQKQSRYIRFSDKVTKLYTPIVHLLALATFAYWFYSGAIWQEALLVATTVLIITCPCAIALAVPVVQVICSGKLFSQGIFIKSGDALEKLSNIDILTIDKTGTLTLGKPEIKNIEALTAEQLQLASSMARQSNHPIAKSLHGYCDTPLDLEVKETAGYGLETTYKSKTVRLGNREWCEIDAQEDNSKPYVVELWFRCGDSSPVCLMLEDKLRPNAKEVIEQFKANNIRTILLSGDRAEIVKHLAEELSIEEYYAELKPIDKITRLKKLNEQGFKPLMVGDGLNDAPALAEAHASISPCSALDITKNTADIIFQGDSLMPVFRTWKIAQQSRKLVRQNIALSLVYNVLAIPLAMAGHVTPLIAAIAMSASSLIVTVNSFRIKG